MHFRSHPIRTIWHPTTIFLSCCVLSPIRAAGFSLNQNSCAAHRVGVGRLHTSERAGNGSANHDIRSAGA